MDNEENEIMTVAAKMRQSALEVLKVEKKSLEERLNPHLDLMKRWNEVKADPTIWEKNTWQHPDYPYNKSVYIQGEAIKKIYDAISKTIVYLENENA